VNFSIQMIDTDGPHSGPYPIGRNEGPATMAEPISYDDFARLELRVAKVSEARPHPHADKLLLSS
jgi:tRNA-binding EMAP/Myf-like protein